MSESKLTKLLTDFRDTAFRLESLPVYDVLEEASDFAAFLAGRPLPPQLDEEWLTCVRKAVSQNKHMRRVRIVPAALTPYIRFEIEWGYLYSSEAGEDIRLVLAKDRHRIQSALLRDFWLFDDQHAIVMNYDADGRFVGTRDASDSEIVSLRQLRVDAVNASISLPDFLSLYRSGQIP